MFVGHELTPSQLFRNRGDGTFEDVTAKAGVGATTFTKGTDFGDYDNDGFPDLYVSNMFGDNFLYHNNRDGTFTEVGKQLHVEKPFASFPTWFFDYDNDGWLDLFVASYPTSVEEFVKHYLASRQGGDAGALSQRPRRHVHRRLEETSASLAWCPSMGANFGDLDNDGYLDFYLGTGSPSFGVADAQHHAQERRAAGTSSTSPTRRAPGTCRRATASPSPISTATATRTSS